MKVRAAGERGHFIVSKNLKEFYLLCSKVCLFQINCCLVMNNAEYFAQAEGFLSLQYLSRFERSPHVFTELWPRDVFLSELQNNRKLNSIYNDLAAAYDSAFLDGLQIEPDSYGGFCLRNNSKQTIKAGEIRSAVGLLVKIPPGKDYGDFSIMEGEKLLVGVACWANHSCRPNVDYYMKGGFRGRPCIRLRALRDIKPGDELCAYYNDDVFGLGNCDCLCENKDLHESRIESSEIPSKRKRRTMPRFKCVSDEKPSGLQTLVSVFDETSNLSIQSFEENNVDAPENETWDIEEDFLSAVNSDLSSDVSDGETICINKLQEIVSSDSEDHNYDTDNIGEEVEEPEYSELFSLVKEDAQISDVLPVSSGNLAASLLSIVAEHNGSDELLAALLKRHQCLFGKKTVSPWSMKSQLLNEVTQFEHSKQSSTHGELIFLKFKPFLLKIIEQNLALMLEYAKQRAPECDLLFPKLKVQDKTIKISLILNTDGAVVCKSPPLSAWPVFIAVADLPPFERQRFQNISMAALYVGTEHPNFNDVFDFLQKELSSPDTFNFQGNCLTVNYAPLILIADLIGKAKILNMKQCNGYYGCTMCTQRGFHIDRVHRYPHDEVINLRSLNSHLENLKALENGSQERLKKKNGRKSDFEMETQGVKGRSSVFSLIPHQPLTSPIDVMHQLFLGVCKDLFLYYYERLRKEKKRNWTL